MLSAFDPKGGRQRGSAERTARQFLHSLRAILLLSIDISWNPRGTPQGVETFYLAGRPLAPRKYKAPA